MSYFVAPRWERACCSVTLRNVPDSLATSRQVGCQWDGARLQSGLLLCTCQVIFSLRMGDLLVGRALLCIEKCYPINCCSFVLHVLF